MISLEQLKLIYKEAPEKRLSLYLPYLNQTMEEFEINNPQRKRMFLAQIGHESAQLRYTEEIASGDKYELRKDLGNIFPGDGVRYKGRGLIQLTGRANYEAAGEALGLNLLATPELLQELPQCVSVCGWYWKKNKLNPLCDAGFFKELTRRINGGLNGYADRYKLYQRAFDVIK